MTPHPAGHSRHTVANQDATPGTSCSLGTTSGSIVSLACWQPPVAAAALDTVTILKKSRRFIYVVLRTDTRGAISSTAPARIRRGCEGWTLVALFSVMTCHAVERGMPAGRCVLHPVAFDAPAHGQRRPRRLEAHETQPVDRQRRSGLGCEGRHGLHGSMTALALEARADVRLVREVRELRQLVHAHPGDWLLLRVVLGDLLDLRLVGSGDLVAPHAALDGRKARVLRAARVAVAVLAVDLVGADMDVVRKVDGLRRGLRGGGRLAAPGR